VPALILTIGILVVTGAVLAAMALMLNTAVGHTHDMLIREKPRVEQHGSSPFAAGPSLRKDFLARRQTTHVDKHTKSMVFDFITQLILSPP
jgi:hypothetical protein